MAVDASKVVVAGNGGVWVAPEGATLPAAPSNGTLTALDGAFVEVGYVSEDGVNFSMERETEEIMAWQSMEPVRVLTTSEPKTLTFECLEFSPENFMLAMQGGTVAGGVYTPPEPGTTQILAMCIEGWDGDEKYRFVFPRVQLSGAVEWNLQKSDAIRLPLEWQVLSSTPAWSLQTTDTTHWPDISRGAIRSATPKASTTKTTA